MRSRILCGNTILRRKRTPTPMEKKFSIYFMCAFQVKLLSMWMPRNLMQMEKGTVVLLVFIISSVFIIFCLRWKCIEVDLLAFTFYLLYANHSVIVVNSWLTIFSREFRTESLCNMLVSSA